MSETLQTWRGIPSTRSLGKGSDGMTEKEFILPVILASQPELRFCFMGLITESEGILCSGSEEGQIMMLG